VNASPSQSAPPPEPEPFDPLTFLALARDLAAGSAEEANLRTAVSRAYYAIFLVIRDWVGLVGRDRVHHKILQVLGRRNQQGIGTLLNDLRRLREIADYQPIPEDPDARDWLNNWREAERIVGRLTPLLQREGLLNRNE
jgi:hypothetical protein